MPTLLYNLELTEEELFTLWFRLTMLQAMERIDEDEIPVLEKLERLLDGR
jgi:hypothetical protein